MRSVIGRSIDDRLSKRIERWQGYRLLGMCVAPACAQSRVIRCTRRDQRRIGRRELEPQRFGPWNLILQSGDAPAAARSRGMQRTIVGSVAPRIDRR